MAGGPANIELDEYSASIIMSHRTLRAPLITIDRLWHLGSLKQSEKGSQGPSYEGNLLSVSACPQAWQAIGRFGGRSVHITTRVMRLLDILTLIYGKDTESANLRQQIIEQSLSNGLLQADSVYRYTYYDDELEQDVHCDFRSQDEALLEADGDTDSVQCISGYFASEKLLAIHRQPSGGIEGIDFAVVEWARDKGFDGVYWDETLDPLGYSAPRGGLFPKAMRFFKEAHEMPDDEDGLAGVGVSKWENIDEKVEQDAGMQPS